MDLIRNITKEFYFPKTYQPFQNFDSHDKMKCEDGTIKKVNFTFKKAMLIDYYMSYNDIDAIMEELGLSYNDSLAFLNGFVGEERFIKNDYDEDILKEAGYEKTDFAKIKRDPVYDIFKDFDALYYDFKKMGIDLIEEDIPFLKFLWILNGLLEEEHSLISKRISWRVYKPAKEDSSEYKRAMLERKDLYSLGNNNNDKEVHNAVRGFKNSSNGG